MKEYRYKAYDHDGLLTEGHVEAAGREEAASMLYERALQPIRLMEEKKQSSPALSRQKLAIFAEEWSSLLEAGLTITDSLSLLEEAGTKEEKKLLRAIGTAISEGNGIEESFRKTGAFPPFFLSLIKVGELSGTLSETLLQLSKYYEKEDRFIKKTTAAMMYPLFVAFFSLLISIVILTFILPSFAILFDALSIPLPLPAAIALSLGLWLKERGIYLILFLAVSLISLIFYLKTDQGRTWGEDILYHFKIYREVLLIRFCYTISALLESGHTLSEALAISGSILSSRKGKKEIRKMEARLEEGEDFGRVISQASFSTALVSRLVKVGMESGELPRFLLYGGHMAARETERKLKRFRTLLEPALLLFTGALTALLVFSVLLPVFTAAGSHLG